MAQLYVTQRFKEVHYKRPLKQQRVREPQRPYNLFGLPAYNTFMGIPWVGANYTSSVVPIIFIIAFAAQVQKVFKRIIQKLFKRS